MAQTRNKQQPQARGDPRRGYGTNDRLSEKRHRDGESRKNSDTSRDETHEKPARPDHERATM